MFVNYKIVQKCGLKSSNFPSHVSALMLIVSHDVARDVNFYFIPPNISN